MDKFCITIAYLSPRRIESPRDNCYPFELSQTTFFTPRRESAGMYIERDKVHVLPLSADWAHARVRAYIADTFSRGPSSFL